MEFSKESLEKFKKAFEGDYGVEFSDEEAKEAAGNLVEFFETLIQVEMDGDKLRGELKGVI